MKVKESRQREFIPQCPPCLCGDEMLGKNSPQRHGEHREEESLYSN